MKKIFKYTSIALAVALAAPVFTACDNDDFDTNQFIGGVNLNSFGPSPVARGGELRFIGSGMDKIEKITIPGCDDITDIQVVSSEEIRITVPQDAQPGLVQLHYAGGVITTRTELTYSEPISLDELTPATVKPGHDLTLTGDYLNLIKEVSFSFLDGRDSVNVFVEDFKVHERKQIVLTVPEEAVSGVVIISDAKTVPNTIKSEQELNVILPAVDKTLDLTNARPGNRVTVKGTDLDLVRNIEMPDGSDVKFTYDATQDAVSFVLPDNSTDGAIVAIPASGVKVAIANIGMVVPTELKATPAAGLRAGDVVTVSGVNMDQVVSVSLPNVEEAVKPSKVSATEVTFGWAAEAQSGNAVLNLKSGKSVEVALATAKPEVSAFNPNPVAAAASVKMTGRNLDLVKEITFPGADPVEPSAAAAAELTVLVPATAKSGALTLTMANGETVTTSALTVNSPECAYVVSVDTDELKGGEIMAFTLANADKLTGVQVNGNAVQYILNGSKLLVNLPASAAKGTVVRLVSSNGEISYTYDVKPAGMVEIVAFEGSFNLGNWDGGGLRIYKDALAEAPAGAKLIFHYTTAGDAQFQINDANWGQQAMVDVAAGTTQAEFVMSADFLNHVRTTADGWSETAIVVNGHTAVISKIIVQYE